MNPRMRKLHQFTITTRYDDRNGWIARVYVDPKQPAFWTSVATPTPELAERAAVSFCEDAHAMGVR